MCDTAAEKDFKYISVWQLQGVTSFCSSTVVCLLWPYKNRYENSCSKSNAPCDTSPSSQFHGAGIQLDQISETGTLGFTDISELQRWKGRKQRQEDNKTSLCLRYDLWAAGDSHFQTSRRTHTSLISYTSRHPWMSHSLFKWFSISITLEFWRSACSCCSTLPLLSDLHLRS